MSLIIQRGKKIMKKITSIVLALMMVISLMTIGIVYVDAKPGVPITIDLPEWEWAITEVSTGNLLGLIDESDMYALDPEMLPGYYVSSTDVPENIGEIKVELYHLPPIPPQEGDDTPFGVVLSKTLNLADLEATSPYSGSVASYSYGERDSETKVYTAHTHSLRFEKSSRRFEASVGSSGNRYGTAFFINKKFMDNLYRDQIIEECGEPLSFSEWANRSSNNRYSLSILASKDGETWYKLYPMTGVKATVVNQDTYKIESITIKYWDYSIPHLGAKYWMLTEGFSQDSSTKIATPTKPLATGTITWYDYGDDFDGFNGTPTDSDYYNVYINAPDEYKVNSLNSRGGAIVLTVPGMPTTGSCGDNVTYNFDDGTLTISGTGDMDDYTASEHSPFYDNDDIEEVIVGNGVTSIGDYSFDECDNIESVTVADSVNRIGDNAFEDFTKPADIITTNSVANNFFLAKGFTKSLRSNNLVNYDESEITRSGDTGASIVTLDLDTANLRVTVPTVLPVSVDSDNNVTVATTAKIVNGSKGQVDVTNAVLSGNNSWTLAAFDTDFKKVPVDTKQYGFKLQGYSVPVSGNAYNNQFDTIAGNASLDLSYDANVAIQSEATKDAEIGNIVFTVAWHK